MKLHLLFVPLHCDNWLPVLSLFGGKVSVVHCLETIRRARVGDPPLELAPAPPNAHHQKYPIKFDHCYIK